ncbi:MAG TPA: hypothetical protein VLG40_03240 [Candidatus Saccharimonas sp.]|nr:hypothetical protein [Candidatus Saccharimonas sp.]
MSQQQIGYVVLNTVHTCYTNNLSRFVANQGRLIPELYAHLNDRTIIDCARRLLPFAIPGAYVRGAVWVVQGQEGQPAKYQPYRTLESFIGAATHRFPEPRDTIHGLFTALNYAEDNWAEKLMTDRWPASLRCNIVKSGKVVRQVYVMLQGQLPQEFTTKGLRGATDFVTPNNVFGRELAANARIAHFCAVCRRRVVKRLNDCDAHRKNQPLPQQIWDVLRQ